MRRILLAGLAACSILGAEPVFRVEEVREQIDARIMGIEAETPQVFSVEDVVVSVPLRVYRPAPGEYPTALLVHGGAWVAGSLETHDNLARFLCRDGEVVVVSVGYTLAPEGKFPQQLDECWAALEWSGAEAAVGDSAGANMVAALCLMARDQGGPTIDLQVLINPVTDLSRYETGFELFQAYSYLEDVEQVRDPLVSPALAEDLSGLPPALIVLAEEDPLRADGARYAEKLREAGVPVQVFEQKDIGHLAGHGARASAVSRPSLDVVAQRLRAL